MSGRLEELLERIAKGVEDLAADPEIEIDSGPAVCPHCGAMNPVIHLAPHEGGTGPLAEIVIFGQCGKCSNMMYAVVESYSMHKNRDDALREMRERADSYNHE